MAKITVSGHIVVPPDDLQAVLDALPKHIALTRAEPGCLVSKVSQDPDQPERFNVYEEFADEESFTGHQQRVQQSSWGAITANVDRHYVIDGPRLGSLIELE